MCFSPEGDLVAGAVIVAVGVDCCMHIDGRRQYAALAVLPVILGLHQIDESLVWWGLQGHVSQSVGRVAMWIYLLFALVVLPTLIPAGVMYLMKRGFRRRIAPFLVIGVAVSAVLFDAMLRSSPTAKLGHYHLAYSIGLQHGLVVIGFYIVATCGPLLVSGIRYAVWLGVANLVAVVVLARLCADGFTSLWCLYAAIVSAVIAWNLRRPHTPHEGLVVKDRSLSR